MIGKKMLFLRLLLFFRFLLLFCLVLAIFPADDPHAQARQANSGHDPAVKPTSRAEMTRMTTKPIASTNQAVRRGCWPMNCFRKAMRPPKSQRAQHAALAQLLDQHRIIVIQLGLTRSLTPRFRQAGDGLGFVPEFPKELDLPGG